ncbi:MAG TPA: TIGR03435 family protein, partial [Candidatus Solibacter sp.]|nr:TIGR03435 family protein [Candidatus Solibacter sp.]
NQQRMQVVVKRAGVPQLIDALSNIFKAPVVDETGLTGRYDVTLDMMKYLADMKPSETGAPPDPQAIILRGIQEELGLKMEPKKMQVEQLVIDKAEKVPSAN